MVNNHVERDESQYLQLCQKLYHKILDEGFQTEDRTGDGTCKVFGTQMRFDLQKGFPLFTHKQVFMRGIFEELMWFLRGDTNNNSLLAKNVHIWDEWEKDFGFLGAIYGHMWRYFPTTKHSNVVEIKIREDAYYGFEEPDVPFLPPIDCDLNSEEMWAIESWMEGKNTKYKYQCKSGFIGEVTRPNWRASKRLSKFDGYKRTIANVGFLGKPKVVNERLYTLWRNMITRCYDKKDPSYLNYGAKGVYVSPIWHSYERFQDTVASVPFFHLWVKGENVCLDKDYFGSGVYSPNTTIFLPMHINSKIVRSVTTLKVKYKGKIYFNWSDIGKVVGMKAETVRLRFERLGYVKKSGDAELVKPKRGYLFRPQVYFDQIEWLLNEIKTNPNSRRLIVSGWNPAVLEDQALPPCHTLFQFFVEKGKLSCQLYQRSADLLLGVPFNIASYALLTHLVAAECDLEVGEFIWTAGDIHVYKPQFQGLEEICLNRFSLPAPKLKLAKVRKGEIESYQWEDIIIEDYEHLGKIEIPVSV